MRRRRRIPPNYHYLLTILLAIVISTKSDTSDDKLSRLRVGQAIDIFARYGYLSLSLKVVPRGNTSEPWVFREPTADVFTDAYKFEVQHRTPKRRPNVFDGEFHMEFCDNARQLLQAYFREFDFEKLDRPWRAFTASWPPVAVGKYLGIRSTFAQKDADYCYVLVRLSRFRKTAKLSQGLNDANVEAEVSDEIDKIRVGDTSSVVAFIAKYGSHYIDSYVTGDSLYQVFVFTKLKYQQLKDRLKTKGLAQIGSEELARLFGPWYAEHVGDIKVASGNVTVGDWASGALRQKNTFFDFPSLLKINGNHKLLSLLNDLLKNEAILQLQMKTLAPAFKDASKRKWFEEVLDNFSRLWESNL